MRILVVEDEPDLAEALARGLRREGYAVDVAHDGADGYVKARVYPYDVVCLDLGLPGMDGRTLCRRLRASGSGARVLMLTARDALEDRIAGLDDGADDYLVKPFAFGELLARVRALARRESVNGGATLQVGDLELDAAAHIARRRDATLPLTPKEFALLRYLMSRAGEVVSEGELLSHVWDERADPRTRTVRVTVMTLRRKLGEPQPIETVVGAGYRLAAR